MSGKKNEDQTNILCYDKSRIHFFLLHDEIYCPIEK